jgi:hypothetical protein
LAFEAPPRSLSAVIACYDTYLRAAVYPALIEICFHHHKAIPPLATTSGMYKGSEDINLTFGRHFGILLSR